MKIPSKKSHVYSEIKGMKFTQENESPSQTFYSNKWSPDKIEGYNQCVDDCHELNPSPEVKEKLISELRTKFIEKIKPINPEIVKIVDENFWDLLGAEARGEL